MASAVLFEDIFRIKSIDPDGKKFDKVSRIEAHSEQFDMHLQLDYNCDIYHLYKDDKFALALATTLNLDGTPDADEGTYQPTGRGRSLADRYEYIMYGKLYKYADDNSGGVFKIEICVSFGGLLMKLVGDPTHLIDLKLDQRLYLLIRKVG